MTEFNPMESADSIAQVAESFGGLLNALVAQGYSKEQAGDLIVATFQQNAVDSKMKYLEAKSKFPILPFFHS